MNFCTLRLMQTQRALHTLHNGCAIRNPYTTCPPHLHMAPAPERPHLHMASRTCTWPRTAAAYNVSPRTHQAHTSHPKKQAYHPNNYSTSTDGTRHSCTGAADFETRCGGARTRSVRRCAHPFGARTGALVRYSCD